MIFYEPIPATDKENMCRKILQKDTLYLITLVFDQGPNKQIKPRGLLFIIVYLYNFASTLLPVDFL